MNIILIFLWFLDLKLLLDLGMFPKLHQLFETHSLMLGKSADKFITFHRHVKTYTFNMAIYPNERYILLIEMLNTFISELT